MKPYQKGTVMTAMNPKLGIQEQCREVETTVKQIMNKLRLTYTVPVPEFMIVWEENIFDLSGSLARIENHRLYLNKLLLATKPYYEKLRSLPVTLELGTPYGNKILTFPYGKILDLLGEAPLLPEGEVLVHDIQIRGEITRVIIREALAQLDGWLASDTSDARCLRNGIMSSYEHLMQGTTPTPVSDRIWEKDPDVQAWRESSGGFPLLFPYLKDHSYYDEVVAYLGRSGPPRENETLPEYIARALSEL